MGCGALQGSWREYVRALKKVSHTYGVSVEGVSQMMSPAKARALWKKLCLKTHPDKGGNPAHLREITDAKRKWGESSEEGRAGRPLEHGGRGRAPDRATQGGSPRDGAREARGHSPATPRAPAGKG